MSRKQVSLLASCESIMGQSLKRVLFFPVDSAMRQGLEQESLMDGSFMTYGMLAVRELGN